MSGFEIAGAVLAGLPLVIAALQYYAKGMGTAKRWHRYQPGLRSLVDLIDTEQTIFSNTIEQLLTGLVRSDQIVSLQFSIYLSDLSDLSNPHSLECELISFR